jgi:thiamine pyrophosphate-dependent acetolactate synthase large subunit-like protein
MSRSASAKNGAELLVRSLEAQGVADIFGVPGGAILPILDVLADGGPRFVLCRHETGAAFMAQAWGRITGTPGVVLTTSGPGLINAVCGVATATEDRDPLVVITGQIPRSLRFKQSHMNLDAVGLFAPVTKWSVEAEGPGCLPEIVANAFRVAARPRPGAVHLSVPLDVAKAAVSAAPIPAADTAGPGAAPPDRLERAAALLNAAKAPAVLLGVGAALARPGRRAVSVSGDGSFLMTCMELETAVRLRLPTLHLVWKDGSYNLIQCLQRRDYGRAFGAEFGDTDFVKLGEALGAIAFRVADAGALVPTLEKALAIQGPSLIEVAIDYRDNHELVAAMEGEAQH